MTETRFLSDEDREELRKRLQERLHRDIRPRRIKALRVNSAHHWQPPLYVEVGNYCKHLEKNAPPMLVLAIFEAVTFLVCTPERGVDAGLPVFFTREDIRQVIEFD
jgi:hypothetical protein